MATPVLVKYVQDAQETKTLTKMLPGQTPQIINHDEAINENCCIPCEKSLPLHLHAAQLRLGIVLCLTGVASVGFGIIGIFTTRWMLKLFS
ncbi:hypothetical protein TrispH2_008324 [Trichoplax sp. H2]|nr:hypothetical protein TrispH2_008324 [Trichoplax sp. H2]|eukprot:RDD39316.1 hypothetical protein TrispH2_008324 [Trichoplax sp. H2]